MYRKHADFLITLVKECIRFGFNEEEGRKYIEIKTGNTISQRHYYRLKKYVQSDPAIHMWLDNFAKVGWAVAHRDRIEEMEKLMQGTWKMLAVEEAREDKEQDKHLILKLKAELREQNKRLTELSLATPIVLYIKSIIANAGSNTDSNTLDYKDVVSSIDDNTGRIPKVTQVSNGRSAADDERIF